MRKRLSLLGIIPIVAIVSYLFYTSKIELPSFYTQLAVALLCFIPLIVIFAFQPEISKLIKKSKDSEKEKNIIVKQNPYDENAHLQTLNSVYQKLSEKRLWETGDQTFTIQVPSSYEEVKQNARLAEMAGVYNTRHIQMTTLANLEPDLTRAITHLEQHSEYKNLVESWNKLQNQIKQYNENIPNFVKFLENHIRKIMAEKTNYNERNTDNPDRGYNLKDIRQVLMLLLYFHLSKPESLSGIFNLRLSKVYNVHVIFEVGDDAYYLIQMPREDPEPDYNQIRDLLLSIVKDETILKEYNSHHNRYIEMLSTDTEFKNNIKPLIDNIEKHGYVVVGKCNDLPY
ncbi:MAG: hypothetical protein ACREA3_09055 [Nitrosotalea sp.]